MDRRTASLVVVCSAAPYVFVQKAFPTINILALLIPLAIFLAVNISLHNYFVRRLLIDTGFFKSRIDKPIQSVLLSLLVLSQLSFPIGRLHLLSSSLISLLYMTLFFRTHMAMFLLIFWLLSKATPLKQRRRFHRVSALFSPLLTLIMLSASYVPATAPPTLRFDIPIKNLPPSFQNFRLAVISDLHIGPTVGSDRVRAVVAAANAARPDAILLVGDIVDAPPHAVSDAILELRNLRASDGVFYVTGNHEYMSGDINQVVSAVTSTGATFLANSRVAVKRGGAHIDIAGVFDLTADRISSGRHAANLTSALDGRDSRAPLVLMAHQPRQSREGLAAGAALVVNGHTHGGQIVPFHIAVWLANPFMAGLYKEGGGYVYVSRGAMYWGPPLRLFAPNEVSVLTLKTV
jgi:uncharacterized protein